MKDIPKRESIPNIFKLVVIAIRIFFRTSIFCIIKLKISKENHDTFQKQPIILPNINNMTLKNYWSNLNKQYRFLAKGILKNSLIKDDWVIPYSAKAPSSSLYFP